MATAIYEPSSACAASERAVPPPTSGLKNDALLVNYPPRSEGWAQVIDELLDMHRLEDDWDGQGAKAPSTALVDSAIQLARILRSTEFDTPLKEVPSRVVPGRTGTVIFEWQMDGPYCELEVTHPRYGELLWLTPGQDTQACSSPVNW